MNVEAIYNTLCQSAKPKDFLKRMGDNTLADLIRHLANRGINSGIPGMITGLAEQEAAARFVSDKLGSEGAVGEG
jgi:hypothetical protein